MIQRDALRARLDSVQIHSESPNRDMSRKVTGTTVDLSLEGYSAMFDGFEIYVNENDVDAAKEVIERFVRDERAAVMADTSPIPYWRRFYFCSIFSTMFPVFLTMLASYHLLMALRRRLKPEGRATLIASVIMYLVGWIWTVLVVQAFLKGGALKLLD
jgi:hypothetical protein